MKINRVTVCAVAVMGGLAVAPVTLLTLVPSAARAQATVKVPEAKLTLVVPTGYQLKKGKDIPGLNKDIVFVCQGPKTDGFVTNANLVLQPAPPGTKADVPSAIQLGSGIKRTQSAYKEVDSGLLTIDGEKAAFHSSTFTVQNHVVHLKQVLVLRGGQMYVLSFGAIASAYAKQVVAFDKMLASIKWL